MIESKIWFLFINNVEEGPFSVAELCKDPRILPSTLAWREGMERWLPICQIPELKAIFNQEPELQETDEEACQRGELTDELVIDSGRGPNFTYFLAAVALLLLLWLSWELFG